MNDTLQIIREQTSAMHADLFEVGVFDSREPRMTLRTWDQNSLLQSIPWLRHQNAIGKDIYIRPHGNHAMSLVDDLSAQSIEDMKAEGVQPSAVIQTSPGNYQAWVHHGQVLPPNVSTQIARDLANEFGGDHKAADWRHFGRLAGFTNRKEKHRKLDGQFPYCRLIEATGATYDRANELVQGAKLTVNERDQKALGSQRREMDSYNGPTKPIEVFRNNPRYGGDQHRADLAYSLYALSHGVPQQKVAQDLASRDLSKKGTLPRQQNYIQNTIKKALGNLGLGR